MTTKVGREGPPERTDALNRNPKVPTNAEFGGVSELDAPGYRTAATGAIGRALRNAALQHSLGNVRTAQRASFDLGPKRREAEAGEVPQGMFTGSSPPSGLEHHRDGVLPSSLQAGLEALSGEDLSGIMVRKNSSKPAQVNASAYTQGKLIHVGPGQEKHLSHEGWHAVQQMQGRVKPTRQVQGVLINDDAGLEREADVMGVRALKASADKKTRPIRASAASGALQRFSAREHEDMGNLGSGRKMVELAPSYVMTYGEMVAMAGDHFESIEQMREFAKKRSGKESRAEIEYVREWKLKQKGRKYDREAKRWAEKRYYTLAARNRSHFVSPGKGDEQRSTKEQASLVKDVAGVDVPLNSIAGYRLNHVKAIRWAAGAGAAGVSIDEAMAVDAFAAHYLTDSFSSGHLRTPREHARIYWNDKVPLFFHNLQGYMAERIAEELRKTNELASIAYLPDVKYRNLTEQVVYERALVKVRNALTSMGRVDFGDLVGLALHDWDSEQGIEATVGGTDARLFGDAKAGTGDEKKYAIKAVELSVRDIERAYTDGLVGIANSETLLLGKDGLYDAERIIPKAKPDAELTSRNANKRIRWKYSSPLPLLKNKHFKKALGVFAKNKVSDVRRVTKGFNKAQIEAMEKGVIEPLLKSPPNVVWWVINWTPRTGGGIAGHDVDDNAEAYYKAAAGTVGGLKSLTTAQRIQLIRDLDAGIVTFDDEEKMIWHILNTARDADMRTVIKAVGWAKIAGALEGAEDRKFRKRFPKAKYGP